MITTLQKPRSLRLKSSAELRAILSGKDTITIEVAEELAAHAIEAELDERHEYPDGITDADVRDSKTENDDEDDELLDSEEKLFEGKRLKIIVSRDED